MRELLLSTLAALPAVDSIAICKISRCMVAAADAQPNAFRSSISECNVLNVCATSEKLTGATSG